MKNIYLKIVLPLLLVGKTNALHCQDIINQKDSLRGLEILQKANIENINEEIYLNSNELQLNLAAKDIIKIVEIVLFSTYEKLEIRKQKPFNVLKKGKYWVVWGYIKNNKRGGVFEIVINAQNLCIEYLSHGK